MWVTRQPSSRLCWSAAPLRKNGVQNSCLLPPEYSHRSHRAGIAFARSKMADTLEQTASSSGDVNETHAVGVYLPDYCREQGRPLTHTSPWWLRWGNTSDSAAETLVSAMHVSEQSRLLQGVGWSHRPKGRPRNLLRNGFFVGSVLGVPRLGVPPIQMQDAGQGFRTIGPMGGTEAASEQVTAWPSLLALAATWDTSLAQQYAAALAVEFRGKGANVVNQEESNSHAISWSPCVAGSGSSVLASCCRCSVRL